MDFHIFADTDHGNKEIIKKESELIEKIVKEERRKNKDIKIVFFTETFITNRDTALIHSILNFNDWKGDPRIIYTPIIEKIKKLNIDIYPIDTRWEVDGKLRDKALFANFKYYHSQAGPPEISLINIGRAHSNYFVEKIKEDIQLRKGENKIYLHTLIPHLQGCKDEIKIYNF